MDRNDLNPLLQIAETFQESKNDWCKILVGDINSRFSFDNEGDVLTLVEGNKWVSAWKVGMKYDICTKNIVYVES
jgi:hypothetical protein